MKAKNIQWDIDFDDFDPEVDELPTEIEIPEGMTDEDEISDYISEQTGFCHLGFSLDNEESDKIASLVVGSTKMKLYAVDVRYYIMAENEEKAMETLNATGALESEYYSSYTMSEESYGDAESEEDNGDKLITIEMVRMGLEKMIITVCENIYGCTGICCKIGDYAFYFDKDNQMTLKEFWKTHSTYDTTKMIYDALKNVESALENGIEEEEWDYYYTVLKQMYEIEKSEYRWVSLMDGTGMGDQTIIYKTNAPVEELKKLEQISCDVYLNDGDYDDVPNWCDVLTEMGYVFEYMDESTNAYELLDHAYPYVTERYVIENQPNIDLKK